MGGWLCGRNRNRGKKNICKISQTYLHRSVPIGGRQRAECSLGYIGPCSNATSLTCLFLYDDLVSGRGRIGLLQLRNESLITEPNKFFVLAHLICFELISMAIIINERMMLFHETMWLIDII